MQRRAGIKGYIIDLPFFGRKEVSSMLWSVRERGQGLIEYALILVLVAMVVIVVLLVLGPVIGNVFTKLNSQLSSF
jgi:pilus assembly protein Flp/PilA